ncbi:MAG: Spy/CpxP family protein refolding chaperone [Chthonomonas sp.]|nr:Spy/CpxP family protein refolding chaperone [Chthonomonas sp.]
MKKLTTLVFTAVLGIGLLTPVLAQPGGGPGPGPGQGQGGGRERGPGGGMAQRQQKIEDKVLAQLNLSDKQKAEIKALREKTKKAMDELRGKGGGQGNPPSDEDRKKMRDVMEGYRTGLEKILTAEQREEFKKLMKEEMEKARKERGEGRGPGRGGPGGPGGGPGDGPGEGPGGPL